MSGRHHTSGAIEYGAEVVVASQLRFAGGDAHPYWQLKHTLRGHGGVDSGTGSAEYSAHAVAGVVEHLTTFGRDGLTQDLVVSLERDPHRVGVGFPPPSRTLDIGEQKGEDAHGDPSPCRRLARARSIWSNA